MKTLSLPLSFLERVAETIKVLGHAERLRIVEFLDKYGESNVGAIVEGIGGRQGAVSQHLTHMRRTGLVSARRQGREVRYVVTGPSALTLLNCVRKEYLKTCE